jgi:hypothetical protein
MNRDDGPRRTRRSANGSRPPGDDLNGNAGNSSTKNGRPTEPDDMILCISQGTSLLTMRFLKPSAKRCVEDCCIPFSIQSFRCKPLCCSSDPRMELRASAYRQTQGENRARKDQLTASSNSSIFRDRINQDAAFSLLDGVEKLAIRS